jgi:hypothetical protein
MFPDKCGAQDTDKALEEPEVLLNSVMFRRRHFKRHCISLGPKNITFHAILFSAILSLINITFHDMPQWQTCHRPRT